MRAIWYQSVEAVSDVYVPNNFHGILFKLTLKGVKKKQINISADKHVPHCKYRHLTGKTNDLTLAH